MTGAATRKRKRKAPVDKAPSKAIQLIGEWLDGDLTPTAGWADGREAAHALHAYLAAHGLQVVEDARGVRSVALELHLELLFARWCGREFVQHHAREIGRLREEYGALVERERGRARQLELALARLPDALRRLARRVEEIEALGPLEREPRRAAIEALFAGRKEIWRLAMLAKSRYAGPTGDALDQMQRARERLMADVGLDLELELELEEQEGGRAR